MLDRLATPDTLKNADLFMLAVRWNKNRNRLADDLFGNIAEQTLGPFIPRLNDAVEVLADDGVIAGLDYGGEATSDALSALVLAEIHQDVDRTHQRAGLVVKRRGEGREEHPRSVRAFRDILLAPAGLSLLHGYRQGILIVRKQRTVG